MAESAVSLVVDKLLPLLTQEVKQLKGVHDELVGVKDELEVIRAFLKDADSKAGKEGIGEGVKVLVNQIREEAHHIEDVIDDYMLHVARHPDLAGLSNLNEMLIDEGALPLLESLEMRSCPMLKEVPSGLQNLRYLEVLSLAWMTKEFNQRWSQQESKISRHVRIHRPDGTYDKDDKASFEAWEERKFRAWEKRKFG